MGYELRQKLPLWLKPCKVEILARGVGGAATGARQPVTQIFNLLFRRFVTGGVHLA